MNSVQSFRKVREALLSVDWQDGVARRAPDEWVGPEE